MSQIARLSALALGTAIKQIREKEKMSANDLAKQIGMTPSTLSRTETGLRSVELAEAIQMAVVIGCSLEDIIKTARHLEASGIITKHQKAKAELSQSLIDVRDAASTVLQAFDR